MGWEEKQTAVPVELCIIVSIASKTFLVTENCAFDSICLSCHGLTKIPLRTQGQYMQYHICFKYTPWHFVYLVFTLSEDTSWECPQSGHIVYSRR